MGEWIQVTTDDQVQICSLMLQSSRPQYQGSLTFNNLSNLLAQTNDDDGSDMFEMYLYQDDDTSDYDLVLVEYLSLKRDDGGTATRHHWCLTFGVSPTTKMTVNQLYQLLKEEVQEQMDDEGKDFWYVHLDGETFTSGSQFDQIYQLLLNDIKNGSVRASGEQTESPYAAYQKDFGKETNLLHRIRLKKNK
jgi:hypothetical protein